MKYSNQVIINQPLSKVLELFDNAENMKEWQPDLISFEPLSGEPGKVGSKSKLLYKMGRRDVEMVETITKKDLPNAFWGTYEAKGVFNEVRNRFVSVDANTTRWESENEFRFSGFMKIIGFFMGASSFRKQSQIFLDNFKAFAER